jgi:MoaA/NifB/PqqE/SkfB family radical SAM enzyme
MKASPFMVQWKITYKCNMKCSFCSIHKCGEKYFPEQTELDLESSKLLVDDLHKLGFSIIDFSGGEPLIKENFEELLAYAKRKNLFIILNTNGMLLEESLKLKKFRENVDLIRISLDSVKNFDEIRGVKGAFHKVVDAIKLARGFNIPITINATINNDNFHEMEDLAKLAKKINAKITFSAVNMHERPITGDFTQADVCGHVPSVDTSCFVSEIIRLKKKNSAVANTDFYLNYLREKKRMNKLCKVLSYSINILPDGSISLPCDAFVIKKINGAGDLQRALDSNDFMNYKHKTGTFDFCSNCDSRCAIYPQAIRNLANLFDLIVNW